MKYSAIIESILNLMQTWGPEHAVFIIVVMAFSIVGFSLYVVLTALKTLSRRG